MCGRLPATYCFHNIFAIIRIDVQMHPAASSRHAHERQLARLAGVAPNSIHGIERGADFKASTMRSLQDAMAAEGILFTRDGGVAARMKWEDGRPRDPRVRASVLKILNSARKSRGQCDLIDIGDGP